MLKLLLRIHRAVAGSESWYAAWQAVKAELKENWPDALPALSSAALVVWTYLDGSTLPWVALAGGFAFVMAYVFVSARRFRHALARQDASSFGQTIDSPLPATRPTGQLQSNTIPERIGNELTRLWTALNETTAEIRKTHEQGMVLRRLDAQMPNAALHQRIERIERLVVTLTNNQIHTTRSTALGWLVSIVPDAPMQVNRTITKDEIKELECYVELVSTMISALRLNGQFAAAMSDAEKHAKQDINETGGDASIKLSEVENVIRYKVAVRQIAAIKRYLSDDLNNARRALGDTAAKLLWELERGEISKPDD